MRFPIPFRLSRPGRVVRDPEKVGCPSTVEHRALPRLGNGHIQAIVASDKLSGVFRGVHRIWHLFEGLRIAFAYPGRSVLWESQSDIGAHCVVHGLRNVIEATQQLHHSSPWSRVLEELRLNSSLSQSGFTRGSTVTAISEFPKASGGSADIYQAWYCDRPVALKLLLRDKSYPGFPTEAAIWKKLVHDNIVPLLGICQTKSLWCMVSPWMNNGNINAYLSSRPHPINLIRLMLDVAHGLDYLHSHGIIHGDLKGENTLIDDKGRACIADFGHCSIVSHPCSVKTAFTVGSLRWTAPELIRGDTSRPTFESEIYSFGMTLWEVFTGKLPFAELCESVFAFRMLSAAEGERPKIRPKRPNAEDCLKLGISDEVWQLMTDCWEENPSARPSLSKIINRLEAINCGTGTVPLTQTQ
ncbi:hypothetical protein JAAARDRAFT_56313 [Jaapia argillacea MUCL 33604]|uniref:Protein kinase domain-containing protein n=1 Tax=Jaapia argillacea MUCL 33604 TaxID=933084 RepID=A0A067Q2P9_9AGAM|nr:hypothetical protein JAAARDRAFT_56313 [Jaapia argillacea MUCL 33604]